jgi:AraC-like DNA-binding protein
MAQKESRADIPVIEHGTLTLWDKMVFERAIVKPPFTLPNHMHDEACFLYIMNGSSRTYSESGSIELETRDSVLMRCGNFLARVMPSETSPVYEAVAVHFYPEVLQKAYGNEIPKLLTQTSATVPQIAKIKADEMLEKYVDSLLFYFKTPSLVTEELLILKLKELLLLLSNTEQAPQIRQILSNLFSPASFEFEQVIETHQYSNISVAELADLTNMSLSSFKREFNRRFGESPATYLRRKKIDRAMQLIRASEMPISHIAWDCGFQDTAHFSRVFKKLQGQSPSEYRVAVSQNSN